MSGPSCDSDNAVLDNRVTNLEKVVDRVYAAVESIAESLTTLTRLEAHHEETRAGVTRAFTAIAKCEGKIEILEEGRVKKSDCDKCHALQGILNREHSERIDDIETEMPTLKMVRGWVITGAMGVLGIFGLGLVNLVFKA